MGGLSFCEKAYRNILGTCWAVAIQTMFTFGQVTSNHLKSVIEGIEKKDFNGFVRHRIGELQSNHQLMDFYPDDILNGTNGTFLEIIMNKFIDRYNSKVSTKEPEKPENREYDLSNTERCELVIAQNFKKLFDNPILKSNNYGGNLLTQYLFINLLSVFFLDKKVSFTNYYDNFQSINFDLNDDLGVLVNIDNHICCLYICDGQQKYYNDNDEKVYNCEWIELLKRTSNIYVKQGEPLIDIDLYEEDKINLKKVKFLTVISKYTIDTILDIDIINILKSNYSNIKDKYLQVLLSLSFRNGRGVVQNDATAMEWAKLAAEQGDADAQLLLGNILMNGQGVMQNKIDSVHWYRLAAEQGNVVAQYTLGNIFLYDKKDNVEAVKWYQLAAAQGYALAQLKLGDMFKNGEGVLQNNSEAMQWYLLAADELTDAKVNVARMFEEGTGVAQDNVKAVLWYQLASLQGHADAQFKLGTMYERGKGVTQDNAEAIRWFRFASARDNADARFSLGLMFDNGTGVAQDKKEAMRFYSIAAAQGHTTAQKHATALFKLGYRFNDDIYDYIKILRFWRPLATQGDVVAQYNLGIIFENGINVAQDYVEAERWYRLAAEQGDANAQYNLGVMFKNGKGIKQDNIEAMRLFSLAAAQEHEQAQINLEEMKEAD